MVARRAHNPEVVRFKSHLRNQKENQPNRVGFSFCLPPARVEFVPHRLRYEGSTSVPHSAVRNVGRITCEQEKTIDYRFFVVRHRSSRSRRSECIERHAATMRTVSKVVRFKSHRYNCFIVHRKAYAFFYFKLLTFYFKYDIIVSRYYDIKMEVGL